MRSASSEASWEIVTDYQLKRGSIGSVYGCVDSAVRCWNRLIQSTMFFHRHHVLLICLAMYSNKHHLGHTHSKVP